MTDTSASPDPIRRPRPTKYPAHLAVMLPDELKTAIVEAAAEAGETQGEIVRRWLALGRELDGIDIVVDRAAVRQLARDSFDDLDEVGALGVLVDFSLREIERRTKRNAELGAAVARDFQAGGISLDGVDVGNVTIEARQ